MNTQKTALVETWYRRVGKLSVGAVLFLILVGGIVRSTGSGMGCPDWPTCFGLLVPPSDISEIPQAFFDTHPGYEAKSFNAFQTWTEYLNRLTGALIGLFTLATAALSLVFWRKDKRIVVLSVAALLLTGFEGWLGKLVVDKNLEGGMVTIHMLVAILIVGILITAVYLAMGHDPARAAMRTRMPAQLRWLGLGVVVITVAQILFGTQVREQVDAAAAALQGQHRELWLQSVDWQFLVHRVLWIVLLGMMVVWTKGVLKHAGRDPMVRRLTMVMLAGFAGEILLGILLSSMDLPPVLQPLHLLFANVIFAMEYALLIHAFGVERFFAGQGPVHVGKILDAKH